MKGRITRNGNRIVHEHGEETLVIEPWGRDGLRVRATVRAQLDDIAWALTEEVPHGSRQPAPDVPIRIDDTEATITNGRITARLTDNKADPGHTGVLQAGFLQFFRDGELLLSEYDYVVGAHNPGTRTYKPARGGGPGHELSHSEVHFAPRPDERFYGMGLNATGSVDLKGSVIDLYQRHVKHVVPFLVSSVGYGLLWNNPPWGAWNWDTTAHAGFPRVAGRSTTTSPRVTPMPRSWSITPMSPGTHRRCLTGLGLLAMQAALQDPGGVAGDSQGVPAPGFAPVRHSHRFPPLETNWRLETGSGILGLTRRPWYRN